MGIFLSSCSTPQLWKDKPSYNETIEQFLINKDEEMLVVLGKKFHYIFSIDDNLEKILLSKKRENITSYFENFKIDSNNSVEGNYTLIYSTNDKESKNDMWLKKLGFEKSKKTFGKVFTYKYSGKLIGKRYLPKESIVSNQKFNREYSLFIEEEETNFDITAKILLTPIAVAQDGVLVCGLIVLSPLVLPGIAVEMLSDSD